MSESNASETRNSTGSESDEKREIYEIYVRNFYVLLRMHPSTNLNLDGKISSRKTSSLRHYVFLYRYRKTCSKNYDSRFSTLISTQANGIRTENDTRIVGRKKIAQHCALPDRNFTGYNLLA